MTNYEYICSVLNQLHFEPLDELLVSELQTASFICTVMEAFGRARACEICPMRRRRPEGCSLGDIMGWLREERNEL